MCSLVPPRAPLDPAPMEASPSYQIRFDTEFSEELQQHKQHRGFSPWVGEKQQGLEETSLRETNYHRFLDSISASPRIKKGSKKLRHSGLTTNLELLKADLTEKINAEKTISRLQFSQSLRSQSPPCRNFLQSRRNFSKTCRKPNSIDLIFQKGIYSLGRQLASTQFNTSQKFSRSPDMKKSQQKCPAWAKRKKQSIQSIKQFTQTMKEFRVGVLQNVKKMLSSVREKHPKSLGKELFESELTPRLKKLYTIKNRPKQVTQNGIKTQTIPEENIGCYGKRAFATLNHKTCRQRVKVQFRSESRTKENQLLA